MNNNDVASALDEIADLLEIAGENTFRIRSYRRAAEVIGALLEEVAAVAAEGRLEELSGIGKGIAEAITELLRDGEITYRRELTEKVPETLLEMLKIPNFGPRKAALVHKELGIATVAELETAAREGRLRELPGMGQKSEQKILQGIELVKEGTRRALLGEILPLAETFLQRLCTEAPGVLACEVCGSTRRRCDTVGDIDLLATSEEPAAVCEWFAAAGMLDEVTMAGDTKVSGRLENGRQVDLRVVAPASWGAALVYFTGSKEHNVRIRERARRMGLTVNEYGVYREEGDQKGECVAGATEEEVYAALDLPLIPPELREDRGEIAAAEEDSLPELIELADIRCDLQMHTPGSDGRDSLEVMAQACLERGYTHLGITDHSAALTVAGGQNTAELLAQIEAIAEFNDTQDDIVVLAGVEADILTDGSLDLADEAFAALDFVIGSIHQGFTNNADRMTERIVTAMASGRMDIFAHPTGRLLLERPAYGIHIEEIIRAAVEYDVALEINASPKRLDLSDIHARLAIKRGARLTINTDAHDREHLSFMRYGVMTARRGWVNAGQVINTWPLEELRRWIASRRQKMER